LYLDTTIKIPFNFELKNRNENTSIPIVLKTNQPETLNVGLNKIGNNNYSSSFVTSSPAVALTEVELSAIGMTDSGLKGITYDAEPQRIDMENNSIGESRINLSLAQQGNRNNAPVGFDQYTLMIKASVPEKDLLFVSLLSPVIVKLDLPVADSDGQSGNDKQGSEQENQRNGGFIEDLSFRNIVRVGAITAAVGLIGYILYMRIKRKNQNK
jgi:hypothetical protein